MIPLPPLSRAWPAPAKLNLFLHLTGRREDGMHTLQTLFQLLDYGDSLDFRLREDGQLRRLAGPTEIAAHEDLAVRAAALLQTISSTRLGADIYVHKRLPAGGGLGGGSSDAATTLVALNRLWDIGAGEDELATMALSLGADVPLFVRGRTAWGEGIGERLTPETSPGPAWFLVLDAGVAAASGRVYGEPDLTRDTPPRTITPASLAGTRNDCEAAVCRLYPEVGRALEWLGGQAPARLTGTGGCVFAGFERRERAEDALERIPPPWRGFVARGVYRSPLLERLERYP